MFLVERSDKRPSGNERSWNFYSRTMDLLGYATLITDIGISDDHVQWLGDAASPAKGALAELAEKAREKLRLEPRKLDQLWADWEKLRPVACPVRTARRDGSVDLLTSKDLLVATVETPLAPADAARNCSAPTPAPIRCMGAANGDVAVVMPFKQTCNVAAPAAGRLQPAQRGVLEGGAGRRRRAGQGRPGRRARAPRRQPEARAEARACALLSHACVGARSGVTFREGRAELEKILGSEEDRQLWLPKIKSDPNLSNWRLDPEFAQWLAQFPTRTPIR